MAEENLTNFKIKDSYEGLLHFNDGGQSTNTSSVKYIYDGLGKQTCLAVSQERLWVDGEIRIGPRGGSSGNNSQPLAFIKGSRSSTDVDTLSLYGNDKIEFNTNAFATPTTRMTVNTTGVGIGTTTPAKTLHVNGKLRLQVDGTEANEKVLTCINTSGDCEWRDSGAGDMEEIVNKIYPVGAIYISVNATNPNTLFAGTSWTRIANGKFLVSAGVSPADPKGESRTFASGADSGKSTAGTYSHKLTRAETPSVTGTITIDSFINPAGFAFTSVYTGGEASYINNTGASPPAGATNRVRFDNGGLSQPHNNTPPWFGAYMWQRTS